MKKFLFLAVLTFFTFGYVQQERVFLTGNTVLAQNIDSATVLKNAYNNRQSNIQVRGEGVVSRILSDDRQGSRHQRFILRLSTGQTLLIAHNIDLAARISTLKVGDKVEFYGEYEWNSQGGIIHWTHRDPNGRHIGGWLKHNGKTYQ